MTFAHWMLLAAALMPYLTIALAKSGGFDNRAPRSSLEGLTGWRRRADWAHRNHSSVPRFRRRGFQIRFHFPQGKQPPHLLVCHQIVSAAKNPKPELGYCR